MLEQLQRSERYTLPTNFAHVHLGLGQFDAAFEWFDRVVEEGDKNMMPILSYANLDPIQDPHFTALLRKMQFGVVHENARRNRSQKIDGKEARFPLAPSGPRIAARVHLGEKMPGAPWVPPRPSVAAT